MVWLIFGLIVALIIRLLVASAFSTIAGNKGHNPSSYFWVCFLLGIIGYCMVAALPDLSLHNKIDELSIASKNAAPASVDTWECEDCGASNSLNYGQCKKCGKFKS